MPPRIYETLLCDITRACHKHERAFVHGSLGIRVEVVPPTSEAAHDFSAIATKLKRRSKANFRGLHFKAALKSITARSIAGCQPTHR
jgi:hypothetical protein